MRNTGGNVTMRYAPQTSTTPAQFNHVRAGAGVPDGPGGFLYYYPLS